MSIHSRLARLERILQPVKRRCPVCGDFPVHHDEKTVAQVLAGEGCIAPHCPHCGKRARVITETVVHSRADVEALEEYERTKSQGKLPVPPAQRMGP